MSDEERYIQYLQENLLSDGFDDYFINLSSIKNLEQLGNTFSNWKNIYPEQVRQIEAKFQLFTPKTLYDNFFAKEYFSAKLVQLEAALKTLGITLKGSISVENSTSAAPTPFARPTSGNHLLFAGAGTMSFCNYWAKIITDIIFNYKTFNKNQRIISSYQIRDCFKRDPNLIVQCSKLCLRYACYGTLLGFGEVIQPIDQLTYRSALVDAMETFIISHELSHFVAEERFSDKYKGNISPEDCLALESFCDELGLQLSRECDKDSNWLTFCGIGALVFFSTYGLCEETRNLIEEKYINENSIYTQTDDHPTIKNRIDTLKFNIVSKTPLDQQEKVESFFNEYSLLLDVIKTETLEIIRSSLA